MFRLDTRFYFLVILIVLFSAGVVQASSADHQKSQLSRALVEKGFKKTNKHVFNEVIVKFRSNVPEHRKSNLHKNLGSEVVGNIPSLGILKVRGLQEKSAEILLKKYKDHPDVEYAELNAIVEVHAIPNDPRFNDLWGLNNFGQSGGTVDSDIDAVEWWDYSVDGSKVVVAVIDTGVDYNHPDLAVNIWRNSAEIQGNGLDDDNNGYVDDVNGWDFFNNDNDPQDDFGHGTHVAGTIGAVGNNGIGVVGVSWNAKIMPIKFIGSNGSGNLFDAVSAIIYAANMGAKISNNSWGCAGCYSQMLDDAIVYANTKGMLFVVSAGNDNNNNDSLPNYPCAHSQPNVLCVAATDRHDQRAYFSNYGAATVHLGAPGVSILSTVPSGLCPLCDPSGYKYLDGTSMAAPHVAGAAALLSSQLPQATPEQLKNRVLERSDIIPAMAGITASGGRLNIGNAYGIGPDLIAVKASGSSSAATGANTSVTATVCNWGTLGVSQSYAFWVLSKDSEASMSDYNVRFQAVPSLLPGACADVSSGAKLSHTMPTDFYYWGLIQDFGNKVVETEEFNNAFVANRIAVVNANAVGPDWVAKSVSAPREIVVEKVFSLSAALCNFGTVDTPSGQVRWVLSADSTINNNDTVIGVQPIPSVPHGQCVDITGSAMLDDGVIEAEGQYNIGMIIDPENVTQEAYETNNMIVGNSLMVRMLPDLIVTSFVASQTTLKLGTYFSVTHIVCNVGAGASGESTIWPNLSPDNVLEDGSDNDYPLGYADVPALASGECASIDQITYAGDITPPFGYGTYYLGAVVNPVIFNSRAVEEVDVSNNWYIGEIVNLAPNVP